MALNIKSLKILFQSVILTFYLIIYLRIKYNIKSLFNINIFINNNLIYINKNRFLIQNNTFWLFNIKKNILIYNINKIINIYYFGY